MTPETYLYDKDMPNKISIENIGEQMLECIRQIHAEGYLCQDIKP
jgi:hypothetical protein